MSPALAGDPLPPAPPGEKLTFIKMESVPRDLFHPVYFLAVFHKAWRV